MTFRRLVPGLVVILLIAMVQSAYGVTAAELRRAVEIERRIGALARDQAALTGELSRVDEAISSATSETVRASLETERRKLQARFESNARERAALRAEFEALPPLAQQQTTAPVGAIGPLDPQGLQPLGASGDPTQVANPRAFNPAISVIPDVAYFRDNRSGGSSELVEEADGFHGVHAEEGHEHGGLVEGFNLRETELAFTAAVDPYFDAAAYLAIHGEGIEAEEVYFQTRALPAGLQVRGGKFLSGIGYVNRQHPHQWDFVDQNLAYELLFGGHGLAEKGVQVTWLPNLPVYLQLGVEALQGENEKFANYVGPEEEHDEGHEHGEGEEHDDAHVLSHQAGPRLFTGFARVAPDLGYSSAFQVGVSFGHAGKHQEIHDHDGDGVPEAVFDGTGSFWGMDVVYKYDSPRQYGAGDLTVQGEYFRRTRDMPVLGVDLSAVYKNDGWYAQTVYGIAPRFQLAARMSQAGLTNQRLLTGAFAEMVEGGARVDYETSSQYSVAGTFNPTEFSRLRVQYNRGAIWVGSEKETFSQLFVQFQVSMGAHGAHRF